MARQSRWQQFADSFNSVYGTFNTAFKNIETTRAMKKDYTDESGAKLDGDALDRAKFKALADIYTKYGDAAGGLALRSNQAALETSNFNNDLNRELRPELIRQKGALQSGLMEAQANNANASAANSYAAANRSNVLLPLDVESKGLANSLARDTYDYGVAEARAAADKATADARVAEGTVDSQIAEQDATAREADATATTAEITAAENAATTAQRVEASLAELKAQAAEAGNRVTTAETAARDTSVVQDIMARAMEQDFGDDTSLANEWIINELVKADMSPQGKLTAAETFNKFGVEQIGARAAQLTTQATEAYKAGGLDGLANLYDNVKDGIDGRVVREGDTVSIVLDRGDGVEEVMATASGPDADRVVATQAMQVFTNPMKAMEMAAATLSYEADQAGLDSTRAETDRTVAQTGLLEAQIEETRAKLEGAGLSEQQKIAQEGLASLMRSSEYQLLQEADPAKAAEMRAEYERALGMPDAPPVMDGLKAIAWYNMTAEEREELLRLSK